MSGLAQHAARVEEMKKRGAFTLAGMLEALNGDGRPTERKELVVRSTPTRVPMDRDHQGHSLHRGRQGQDRSTPRSARPSVA